MNERTIGIDSHQMRSDRMRNDILVVHQEQNLGVRRGGMKIDHELGVSLVRRCLLRTEELVDLSNRAILPSKPVVDEQQLRRPRSRHDEPPWHVGTPTGPCHH